MVGYNYQINSVVVGIEGNLDAVLGGSKSTVVHDYTVVPNVNYTVGAENSYSGDVRGRLGYAFDRVLLFIDGGVAFGDVKTTYANTGAAR